MKRLNLLWSFLFLLLVATAQASVIDAPHNETQKISCSSCHSYSLWWQYSPTTQNPAPNDHTAIVDAVCMKCHGNSGAEAKAMTHSSTMMDSTLHGDWGVGCMACHNPHYQGQLAWVGSVEPYLVTGTISNVAYDSNLDQSTITYTGATINPNWPAAGDLPTDLDWANKSLSNPNRGLILVHDTEKTANTFLIISANSTQVEVHGRLDASLVDATTCVDPATLAPGT